MHGSGSNDGRVPDCWVAMKSCIINHWGVIKVNSRDLCLGNDVVLIKSDSGVMTETILITEHFKGIYPLIFERICPQNFEENCPQNFEGICPLINFPMSNEPLIQLLIGFFESIQWVIDCKYIFFPSPIYV